MKKVSLLSFFNYLYHFFVTYSQQFVIFREIYIYIQMYIYLCEYIIIGDSWRNNFVISLNGTTIVNRSFSLISIFSV